LIAAAPATGHVEAVLFDFDGVLTRDKTGSLTTLRFLSQATGIAHARLHDAFRPHNSALNLGRTTHAAIWPQVCAALGQALDPHLLAGAFESTPMDTGMLRLAQDLRRHVRVGIVTDNKQDRIDHLRRHLALDACFDPIVVSAEVGADKEGPAIFRHALERLALPPQACVFIDNSAANLVAPRQLGLHVLHFDDEARDLPALVGQLKALGIPLP
jgi:HAD superfamily hydrolase (TIGR01509 family)